MKAKKSYLNREVLTSLRNIMQDDYFETLQNFLDDSLSQYSLLHETYETEHYEKLEFIASVFRESCASIGADKLVELAGRIEQLCAEGHYHGIGDLIFEMDQIYEPTRMELLKEQKTSRRLAS